MGARMSQLPLPITPEALNDKVLTEAFAILPKAMGSDAARVMLTAIALQESGLAHRRQVGGPARGLFQFEQGGGVKGVMTHPASAPWALQLCNARLAPFDLGKVYAALELDDVLAAGFARLLLWTDSAPLPANDDPHAGWALYQRVWRPGKPHPETWPKYYAQAVAAVAMHNAERGAA